MANKYQGQFGAAVIGDEAAKEEKVFIESGKNVFGPSVLDSDTPVKTADLTKNSKRVLTRPGRKGNTKAKTVKKERLVDPEDFRIGIRGLRRALLGDGDTEGNPLLVDEFMKAELLRPDGVRKTACTILTEAEGKRPDGPREEVLATLSDWLEGAG